ncbi:type IV secretory system conjugative DNA transfer family protein (plasmid) [Xylella fastidiosa subsp. pauca]|uniref:type IV secretory system conjugative DNA transfer family protein n=1 Tax=Xylella fastidiosa TaxID=2371 RepID=UPI00241DC024|nr:type IV secretory system conjugative DNA transfer family protein [Xylella fastidiosa]MDG5824410.1 type IV secretory system conjugative DNA transfer family protein [Xylella fastidiosa subsp. pauca]MDG5827045.1 type IV secretory system conjugative DNA transfer family protein [Xylella fastidiosa subsp. pauca]
MFPSPREGHLHQKSESQSISDQRRALLLPQEITSLGSKRALVVVEDCPPILAKRIRYFREHVFMDRLKSVSPSLAKFGNKLPNEKQLKAIIESGELAVKVPVIDIDEHICMVSGSTVAQTTVVVQSNGKTEVHVFERLITPADMPNLAKIALANLNIDFSAVEKAKDGQLDEAALHSYVENLSKQSLDNV